MASQEIESVTTRCVRFFMRRDGDDPDVAAELSLAEDLGVYLHDRGGSWARRVDAVSVGAPNALAVYSPARPDVIVGLPWARVAPGEGPDGAGRSLLLDGTVAAYDVIVPAPRRDGAEGGAADSSVSLVALVRGLRDDLEREAARRASLEERVGSLMEALAASEARVQALADAVARMGKLRVEHGDPADADTLCLRTDARPNGDRTVSLFYGPRSLTTFVVKNRAPAGKETTTDATSGQQETPALPAPGKGREEEATPSSAADPHPEEETRGATAGRETEQRRDVASVQSQEQDDRASETPTDAPSSTVAVAESPREGQALHLRDDDNATPAPVEAPAETVALPEGTTAAGAADRAPPKRPRTARSRARGGAGSAPDIPASPPMPRFSEAPSRTPKTRSSARRASAQGPAAHFADAPPS
jgi:hypothetical protein